MHTTMTSEITLSQYNPKKRRRPQHKRPRVSYPQSMWLCSSHQRGWRWFVLLCGFIYVSQRLPVIESSTRRHPALLQPYNTMIHPSSRHVSSGRNDIHHQNTDDVDSEDDDSDMGSDIFVDLDKSEEEDDLLLLQQRDRIRIMPAAWILSSSSSMATSQSSHHHHHQWQPDMTDTNSKNDYDEEYEEENENDGVSAAATTTTSSTMTMIQPPQMNIEDMANVLQFTSLLNAKIQQVCRNSSYSRTRTDTPVSVHGHHPHRQGPTIPRRMKWQPQPPHLPVAFTHEPSHRRVDELRGGGGGVTVMSNRVTRDHEPYRIRNTVETASSSTSSVAVPFEREGTLSHSSSSSYPRNHMAAAFHSHHHHPPMDDLHNYLLQIHQLLQLQPSDTPDTNRNIDEMEDSVTTTTASISLERTLMMLYLDRACSNTCYYHVKLPYCTPSTVHYLCVTAMLVAAGAVRGDMVSLLSSVSTTTTTEYDDPSTTTHDHNDSILNRYNMILQQSSFMQSLFKQLEVHMGIPAIDSQYRVSLMLQALAVGRTSYPRLDDDTEDEDYDDDDDDDDDSGIFVTPSALQEWKEQWESRFDGR